MNENLKVISYKGMKDLIEDTPKLRTRAMLAVQYGLGARAGELIKYTHTDGRETIGLLKSNIELLNDVWVCSIPNFKNVKQEFKKPYISPVEEFVYDPLKEWLDVCGEQVFGLRISRYRQLVSDALPEGLASHCLRHSRASHLAEVFKFNAYEIKAFLGHARLDTSAIYVSQDLSRSKDKIETHLRGVNKDED